MRPFTYPRGSLHDMQELAGLSDVPDQLLLVSDRTLSLLQDFARVDVAFYARYAWQFAADAYVEVVEGSAEAVLVDAYISALQLELVPVPGGGGVGVFIGDVEYLEQLPLGYSGVVRAYVNHTMAGAGDYTLAIGTVPADTIWVVENLSSYFSGTSTGVSLYPSVVSGGNNMPLMQALAPSNNYWFGWPNQITLAAGEQLVLKGTGLHANDVLYAALLARKISLVPA